MALNQVTVTGTIPGANVATLVEFTPSNWLQDATDSQTLPPAPVPVNTNGSGHFSVALDATDNNVTPAGWYWTITISGVPNVDTVTWSFFLLFSNGATQDLSTLVAITPPATLAAYLPLPSGTPTAGEIPQATGSGQLSAWGLPNFFGMFGDGSDGPVTLDGTTNYSGFSTLSGGAYTLTRDVYATNFTLNAGVTLHPANFRIFCRGTLTLNGTITNPGTNAAGAAGGAVSGAGSLQGGQAGATGGTGAGAAGAAGNGTFGVGNGGAGGSGSNGAGGGTKPANGGIGPMHQAMAGYVGIMWGKVNSLTIVPSGGVSGSSGGGDGTNSGGGGGGGGNSFIALAWAVVLGATLVVNLGGGTGGTPPAGNCGGGGGGGGGNFIIYSLTAWVNNGATINQAGGLGGSGVGSGTAGSAGTSGSTLNEVVT